MMEMAATLEGPQRSVPIEAKAVTTEELPTTDAEAAVEPVAVAVHTQVM